MKPDLRKALEELALAHDELGAAVEGLANRGGIDQVVALNHAKDRIATAAYATDRAFRPRHYARIFRRLEKR
jgi:cellobiose-specific phosphotransferase system component IIA